MNINLISVLYFEKQTFCNSLPNLYSTFHIPHITKFKKEILWKGIPPSSLLIARSAARLSGVLPP